MGSPQVGFFFRVEPSTVLYIICLVSVRGVCFLLSGAMLDAISTLGGSTIGVCTIATPLEFTHGRHMCNLVMVISPHQVCTEWLLPPLHWVGGALCCSICCSPAIPSIWWGIQLWELGRESPNPSCLPYMVERGLLFQVWFHPMTQSTLNLQWALNLVILVWWLGIRLMSLLTPGLQSGLWLIPTFILGFTGKVSSLTHFPLEPGLWGLLFSGPGHGWLWTRLRFYPHQFPWDTRIGCFLGWAWCHSIFSLFWFLCLVSTLSDNSKPQLAPSIRSHKLWCQARALLAPAPLATKIVCIQINSLFF